MLCLSFISKARPVSSMIPLALFAIPQISFKLHLKRGEVRFPQQGFSQILAMACAVLGCASLLIQASVILSR